LQNVERELNSTNNKFDESPFERWMATSEEDNNFVAKPDTFNGKEFRKWWRTVLLFIAANPRCPKTDQSKMMFAVSYMKRGTADMWRQRFIAQKRYKMLTWQGFELELEASFLVKDLFKNQWTSSTI
jgi:hypothetical protein